MGGNKSFYAKRAKYSKICMIKTTNAILTKFCIVIKTIKFALKVVPKFAPQIQNGGWSPFLKIVICDISATVLPILIIFGTVMHISHPNLTRVQMFQNLKIQNF